MSMIKIAIAGASGYMGQTLLRLCADNQDFQIVGASDAPNAPSIGKDIGDIIGTKPLGIITSADVTMVCENADVFIDFTIPKATIAALEKISAAKTKAIIIGTTGFDEAQDALIREFAKTKTIVKSGNFSLGVNLLANLVKKAAQTLGEDWDIEIIEAHHRRKIDAPSGTALLLGNAAADGRGESLGDIRTPAREGITGARKSGSIGFSAIRGGGIIGEHDVRFESASESVILSHKAHDRNIFAKGALVASKWAINQPAGFYDMKDVLGD